MDAMNQYFDTLNTANEYTVLALAIFLPIGLAIFGIVRLVKYLRNK